VIIQTYQPEHTSLIAASDHDFNSFAEIELGQRQELGYPPFSRLANIKLSSNSESSVKKVSREIANIFRRVKGKLPETISILGPAPSPLYKLRSRYRWQILVKASSPKALAQLISGVRAEITPKLLGKVRFSIDVDPINML
jgi:primosomal protein N' (replication factor Y) (superfamily II helicase)